MLVLEGKSNICQTFFLIFGVVPGNLSYLVILSRNFPHDAVNHHVNMKLVVMISCDLSHVFSLAVNHHVNMKLVVVRQLESLLHRPNISQKAQ